MAESAIRVMAHPARSRLILASGLLMLPIGVVLLAKGMAVFLAILLVAAGALNLFNGLKTVVWKQPLLEVDAEGITDRMNMPSTGFTPWDQVASIEVGNVAGIEHLLVHVRDPEAIIAAAPRWKRWMMRSNLKTHGTFVFFRTNVMPEDGPTMRAAFQRVLDHRRSAR